MGQPSASGKLIPPLKTSIDSDAYAGAAAKATLAVARSLTPELQIFSIEGSRSDVLNQVGQYYIDAATRVYNGEMDSESALNEAQLLAGQVIK